MGLLRIPRTLTELIVPGSLVVLMSGMKWGGRKVSRPVRLSSAILSVRPVLRPVVPTLMPSSIATRVFWTSRGLGRLFVGGGTTRLAMAWLVLGVERGRSGRRSAVVLSVRNWRNRTRRTARRADSLLAPDTTLWATPLGRPRCVSGWEKKGRMSAWIAVRIRWPSTFTPIQRLLLLRPLPKLLRVAVHLYLHRLLVEGKRCCQSGR
mmetsp:Transcript_22382/g.48449  ORF Transcript_22382/g.48449 Transcript_22382/m.48449 type:complete len:207 (+) Transcript_22382:101-721(+)